MSKGREGSSKTETKTKGKQKTGNSTSKINPNKTITTINKCKLDSIIKKQTPISDVKHDPAIYLSGEIFNIIG